MAFIHQHQVFAFKGFHGNGFFAHFVAQLVDVNNLNRALEDTTAILVKHATEAKTRQIQFSQVLARQAFIRREQNDLVRVGILTVLEIVQVLANIHMQQKCLAAARGVPEGELVQLVSIERLKAVIRIGLLVVGFQLLVQPIQQSLGFVEIPVQINLCKEQRQILEILHVEDGTLKLVTLFGNGVPVLDNVQVIATKFLLTEPIHFKQVLGQFMEKAGLPIIIYAFMPIFTQTNFQAGKTAPLEEAQQPLVKNKLFVKAGHGQASVLNMRFMNSGSIWRIFRVLVIPPSASVLVKTAGIL